MGSAAEGMNIAHGVKKVDVNQLKAFRDRFDLPISDEEVESYSYYKPDENSHEVQYLKEKRAALGGLYHKEERNSQINLKSHH